MMAGQASAQGLRPNEREAKPKTNVEDKDDVHKSDGKIWVLNFKFYPPRLITVNVPGRGLRLLWYVKYEVANFTKDPHVFIPDFEWVTIDKPGVYHDEVLHKAQEAIIQREDPTGFQDIQNSVTISSKPIPPSRPEAPKKVTGVAIWDNINPNASRFSVFVNGLSNGWSLAELPPNNTPVVRKKTLQLNFRRVGDKFFQRSEEIQFVGPEEWIYRAPDVSIPGLAAKTAEDTKK